MKLRTILALSALAAGASYYFGKNKIDQYKHVLQNLQVKIKDVKNLNFHGTNIGFDVDVQLTNPTGFAIQVPGEKIIIRKLHFSTPGGKFLGTATPNLSNLEMPANESRLLKNIPVTAPLSSVSTGMSELNAILSDPENFIISIDFEVFGKPFSI